MAAKRAGYGRRRFERFASLGARLVLILTGVGLVGAAAVTLMLASVITPSFDRLEQDAVNRHVARTQAALAETASRLEGLARDYGDWNAGYAYAASPSSAFEQANFTTVAMADLGVDGMVWIRPDHKEIALRGLDAGRTTDDPARRAALSAAVARLDLERALGGKASAGFYLRVGDGIAVVGVARVRRTDGSGRPRGYVLMTRRISQAQLATLTQLDARFEPASPSGAVTIDQRNASVRARVPLPGPAGAPVAAAVFDMSRDLSLLGKRMLLLAVIGTTVLLVLVLWVLRRAIARLVIDPLHRVERHMAAVRSSGALTPLTEEQGNDEIGHLVIGLNAMLRQLHDLREQLEVQSFTLGRSESAVAVMHNVRNALNPISTILSDGLGRLAVLDRTTVDKAFIELARGDVPDMRRVKLVAFLAAAARAVEEEREERRRQLQLGREALQNVLEIIGAQQEAAHERPELEACNVSDLIAQNATIARYSGERSIAVSFPSRSHWAMANRVILSQVIGNLFANATEAITAVGRGNGSIAVSVHERDSRVEIVIRDDGEGFDPMTAATLFQRGFSTREHKSGGLGLHWCANSMTAMDGTLELRSAGKGTGASAVLTLKAAPMLQAERELAA